MGKLVLIKGADFSNEAVEQVNILIDAPSINISQEGLVTIASNIGTVAVYYTIDGTNPTTSSILYSDPFVVTDGTTVKAIAEDSSGNFSAIASAYYTTYQDLEQTELAGFMVSNEFVLVSNSKAKVIYCDVQDYIGKQVKINADLNDIIPFGATVSMFAGFYTALTSLTYCISGSGFELVPGTEQIVTVPQGAKYFAILTAYPNWSAQVDVAGSIV
jgi:hypothetical protein